MSSTTGISKHESFTIDCKAECEKLKEELCKMKEQMEISNCKNIDMSKTIAYLEGQVRAFEFCVTRGGVEK